MRIGRLFHLVTGVVCALSLTSCSSARKPSHKAPKKVTARIPRMNVSWTEVRANPAGVEVLLSKPISLVETNGKDGFLRVPKQFREFHTTIYTLEKPMLGVADYRVTKPGYLFVACNYTYQGNSGGGWQETRWMRDDFFAHGWREATSTNLGGILVNGNNQEYVVFIKKVSEGESGRLRCNKYEPPLFIITSDERVMSKQ